jgi:[ribosomal protein S18]-alanine N-acetyltransferase
LPQSRYNGGVPFRIRRFERDDFETLWRIDQACFDPQLAYSRPELAFYMRRPSAFTLVALDEGKERLENGGEPRGPESLGGARIGGPKVFGSKVGGSRIVGSRIVGSRIVGSRILGFIVVEKPRQTGHIITIDVLEEARRLGVGSALLTAAERQLRENGAVAVELETAVNNEGAIHFYKQKGYFVERTVRGYYSNQLDALVMGKPLADSE